MRSRAWFFCIICMASGVEAADTGDDFSNNLVSDLAPLLSLFGEQFAQQFMSESMGWLDHIVFAMAPLGILTTVVAAIRVGGPAWLRAVIGRARENRGTVELELMSSTSHEVCELWNGQGIVRTMGTPQVQEIIYLPNCPDNTATFGLYTLESATAQGLFQARKLRDPVTQIWSGHQKIDEENVDNDVLKKGQPPQRKSAPNISLNLHGGSNLRDLLFVAVIGIVLQSGVLVFSGFSVYHPQFSWRFLKDGKPVRPYAYPVMACGTILLTLGLMICSAIVEYSTQEKEFIAKREDVTDPVECKLHGQILWLQRSHVVSDQVFNASVIFRAPRGRGNSLSRILTSQRAEPSPRWPRGFLVPRAICECTSQAATVLGVLLTLCGFVLQFQGLRGLNWTSSIAQLISIALMTALRAWVRRHLILAPIPKQVPAQHELDWLALWFARRLELEEESCSRVQWPKDENEMEQEAEDTLIFHMQTLDQWGRHVQKRTRGPAESSPSVDIVYVQGPPQERLIWTIDLAPRGNMRCVRVDPINSLSNSPSNSNQLVLRRRTDHNSNTVTSSTPGHGQVMGMLATAVADGPADHQLHDVPDRDLTGRVGVPSGLNNRAQRALKIRERLARLTKWQGHSAAAAMALARSISWTLNSLFQGSDPDHHHDGSESFCWPVDVRLDLGSGVETIEFHATRDKSAGKRWAVDPIQIEAALSLWIFHIREMWGIRSHKVDSSKQVGDVHFDKQSHESDLGVKLRIVRLLGLDTPRLRRDLWWWIGDNICFKSTTSGVDSWSQSVDVDSTNNVFEGPIGLRGWGENFESADSQPVLTTAATGSLESLLSQHLFTVFLWAVVKDHRFRINDNGTTISAPNEFRLEEPSTLLSLRLENKTLQELARTIQGTGLCDLQDAYLCLIPPLSCGQLLPSLEVVKFVSMKTKGAEQTGQWNIVVPMYIRLAREFDTFGNPNQAFLQANAILIEMLISITDIIKIKGDSADRALTQDFEGLRADIESELKKLPYEVRQMFAKIHEMQARFASDAYGEFWYRLGISLDRDTSRAQGDTGLNTKAMDILGWSGLHYAAISISPDEASCQQIQSFLQLGVNPNEQDMAGQTPLYYAAESVSRNKRRRYVQGSVEKIRELIRGGADPNICARNGRSPLHCAAEYGDRILAELLLVEGARMEVQDHMGHRPLHLAAFGGNLEVANILLEKGAHTTVRDHDDRTPLHIAALAGSGTVASRLLQVPNIETEIKDRFEQTPLDVAGRGANCNVETFKIIFDATIGADGGKSEDGCSPFLYAVRCGKIQIVHRWLQASAASAASPTGLLQDTDHLAEDHDNDGLKAVHLAVKHDHRELLVVLLNARFLVNTRSSIENLTPLHVAALHGRVFALGVLIKYGALLDLKTGYEGFTALHIAVKSGQRDVVERLLAAARASRKIDLIESRTISQGLTALHIATRYGHIQILQLLIKSGALLEARTKGSSGRGYSALHIAVKYGQCDTIVQLLNAGISVDITTSHQKLTALHIAVRYNQLAALKILIRAGAFLEAKTNDYYSKYDGFNALHLAVIYGHWDVARALLGAGIEINSRTSTRGFTPLHLAARYGDVGNIIELLIERGAGLEENSRSGFKALYLAVMGGHRDIIEQLLAANAQPESRFEVNSGDIDNIYINAGPDDYELNICPDAVSVAASYGYTDIVKLLLRYGASINTRRPFDLKITTLTVSGSGRVGIYPGALFAAVCGGHLKTTEFLIRRIQRSKATEADMVLNPGKFSFTHVLVQDTAKLTIGYTERLDIEALKAEGSSQLKLYRGLLSAAAGEGYTGVLRHLLQHANSSLKKCPPALVRISSQLWLTDSAQMNIDYSTLHLTHVLIEAKLIAYRGALLAAIHKGETESVRLLLSAGVHPNENQGGYIDIGTGCGRLTLTHNGTIDLDCEALISVQLRLRVDERCKFNIYAGALSAAAANGLSKILVFLLEAGAISGSPQQVIRGLPHLPLIKDWARVKISMNAMQAAMSNGNTDIASILQHYEVAGEVGSESDDEQTAIHPGIGQRLEELKKSKPHGDWQRRGEHILDVERSEQQEVVVDNAQPQDGQQEDVVDNPQPQDEQQEEVVDNIQPQDEQQNEGLSEQTGIDQQRREKHHEQQQETSNETSNMRADHTGTSKTQVEESDLDVHRPQEQGLDNR